MFYLHFSLRLYRPQSYLLIGLRLSFLNDARLFGLHVNPDNYRLGRGKFIDVFLQFLYYLLTQLLIVRKKVALRRRH